MPGFSAKPAAGSTTSAWRDRVGDEAVDGEHEAGAGRGPGGPGRGRGSRRAGRRRAAPAPARRPSAAAVEDAARRRGRWLGQLAPAAANQSPPVVERDPPGQHARGQAHVEGAVHVAPAQAGQEPSRRARPRPARRPRRRSTSADSASDGRPSTHDHRPGAPQRARGPGHARRRRSPPSLGQRWSHHGGGRRPGGSAATRWPAGRGRRSVALSSTSSAPVDDRVAQPQVEDGQLLLEVGRRGAPRRRPRMASSMVARGRPSTTSAGRPSPSWQSTCRCRARCGPASTRRRRPRW